MEIKIWADVELPNHRIYNICHLLPLIFHKNDTKNLIHVWTSTGILKNAQNAHSLVKEKYKKYRIHHYIDEVRCSMMFTAVWLAYRTWTVEFMIKSMVSEIWKIDSNLSQTTHIILITVTAKAWIWFYTFVDFILQSLNRHRRFDFAVKSAPMIDTMWEKTLSISPFLVIRDFGSYLRRVWQASFGTWWKRYAWASPFTSL